MNQEYYDEFETVTVENIKYGTTDFSTTPNIMSVTDYSGGKMSLTFNPNLMPGLNCPVSSASLLKCGQKLTGDLVVTYYGGLK